MRVLWGVLTVVCAVSCSLAAPEDGGQAGKRKPGVITLALSMGGGGARMARTIAPQEKTVGTFDVAIKDAQGNDAYPPRLGISAVGNAAAVDIPLNNTDTGLRLVVDAKDAFGAIIAQGSHQLVEADFISGVVAVSFTGTNASEIALPVLFPASLNVAAVHAELTNIDNPVFFAEDWPPLNTEGANKKIVVSFHNLSAGSYRLRLDFERPAGTAIKTISEAVIVEAGFVSNRWSAHDGSGWLDKRELTAADFPGTAAALGPVVMAGGAALTLYTDTASPENQYIALGNIANPAAASFDVSVFPALGAAFTAALNGADITSAFTFAGGGAAPEYRASLSAQDLEAAWELRLTGTAADGGAVETYTLRPARAELLQGTAKSYYKTLALAAAAAGGSSSSPDVITLLSDISIATGDNVTLSSGAHIRLTAQSGISRTVRLANGYGGAHVFQVNGGASLTFAGNGAGVLTVDGNKSSVALPTTASLVYVDSGGSLTLEQGAVLQNAKKTSGVGTALIQIASNSSFVMNAGKITGLERNDYGPLSNDGTFIMNGGEISGNTAAGSSGGGGGVYNYGTFTMNAGLISGNTAQIGGGVHNRGSFSMSGGEIAGNTAAVKGRGVFADAGSFKMGGGAKIALNNDIFLASGKTVEIAAAFTAPLPDYAAVITPAAYTAGIAVLSGSSMTGNTDRFGITPSGGTSYTINSSGQLQTASIPAGTVYWLGGTSGNYTSDSGVVVIPVGKTAALFMVGGGGGGNGGLNDGSIARGGGGGAVQYHAVVDPGVYPYQIGAGGNGGMYGGAANTAGGNTSFSPAYTAAGGAKGSDLPNQLVSGTDGAACALSSSLTGLTLTVGSTTYTLTDSSLKYGAQGGSVRGGSPPTFAGAGATGGGTAITGYPSTAGAGSFYGAGGGGANGAGNAGGGFKGVIFVKFN